MHVVIIGGGEQVANIADRPGVPEQCVVVAVPREEEFVLPHGDTELQAGDHVVLVRPRKEVKAAQDAFTGTPAGARK